MVRVLSASPWWKTSSESARPRAACAASLKAALKRCTTWFLSPTGANSACRFAHLMVAPLKVGIAGLGTVGAEVVRLIEEQSRMLSARSGRGVRVVAVTARSKVKKRSVDLRGIEWAKNPLQLAGDPGIDCFVELMGGSGDPAFAAIEAALKSGKSVVTANKALIARHGLRLAKAAEKHGGALNFEAAVGPAIPIVQDLPEGLAGSRGNLLFP